MRIKKQFVFIGVGALLLPLTLIVTLIATRSNIVSASRTYPTYQLLMSSGNPLTDGSHQTGNKTYKTQNNNNIIFAYNNVSASNGAFTVLEDSTSFLQNTSALNGLVSIDYAINSGSFFIEYGWNVDEYENSSSSLSENGTYLFNQEYPSFFRIGITDRCVITSLTIKYSCEASVNPYKELEEPVNPNDEHQYHQKEFVDFPTFDTVTPGLTYTLSDDGTYYIVDNYWNTMDIGATNDIIVFPNTYNDLPVKEIGNKGFMERWWISGIYIPSNIERIQNETFEQVGLTKIYWNARNCEDFAPRNAIFYPQEENTFSPEHIVQNIDLVFGPDVEHIPARLLYPTAMDPTKLPVVHSVSFSKNSKVTSIGDYAFYGVNGVSSIYLPDTIETIGDYAFYSTGVDEFDLPASLKSIGNFAFMFSEASYVRFPSSLASIGEGAFQHSSLIDLDLSITSLTSVSDDAFAHSESLNYMKLPSTLLSIGEGAFSSCSSLISINAPDTVTSIGSSAFKDDTSVSYIYLGRDLSVLGNSAFEGLVNVSTLVIRSRHISDLGNNNKVFLSLGKNANNLLVFFKYGVEYIPSCLFYPSSLIERQPHINRLVLSSSITGIGDYVFNGLTISCVEFYGSINEYDLITIGSNNAGLANVKARGI